MQSNMFRVDAGALDALAVSSGGWGDELSVFEKVRSCMSDVANRVEMDVSSDAYALGTSVSARKQLFSQVAVRSGMHPWDYDRLEPRGFPDDCYVPELLGSGWHVLSGLDSSVDGGYCYIAAIRPHYRELAKRTVGKWPQFHWLVALPSYWFIDDERMRLLLAATDDGDSIFQVRAYSLLDVLVYVSHAVVTPSNEFSLAYRLRAMEVHYTEEDGMPVPECRVGGTDMWHIAREDGKVGADGFCYLALINHRYRGCIGRKLGAWPTLESLLLESRKVFIADSVLNCVYFTRRPGDGGDAIPARLAFIVAAHDMAVTDKNTFAGKLYPYTRVPEDVSDLPRKDHRVGGAFGEPVEKLSVRVHKRVKYVQPVSDVDADKVFDTTYRLWGLPPDSQDDVVTSLAELMISGTSDVAMKAARFVVDGVVCHCADLVTSARGVIKADNAVRLWAKSFRGGELVLRMSELLGNPDNTVLRQWTSAKYRASDSVVHLCFDMASVLRHLRPTGYTERSFIRLARGIKFTGRDPPGAWRQSLRIL